MDVLVEFWIDGRHLGRVEIRGVITYLQDSRGVLIRFGHMCYGVLLGEGGGYQHISGGQVVEERNRSFR
ncbi:hypothetical protein DB346_03750 [Verrucomicrobia bacterium LW23]|nr:hypothetical protein DB346_03750 [Verrucomicrobia bacterium LW23]